MSPDMFPANGSEGKHFVSRPTNLVLSNIVLFVLQMGIFKPVNTIRGRDASGSDNVLTDNLNAGLDVPATLPTLMIVGALCYPLLQNGARMVAATLCTHHQLEDGMKHLTNFVKEFYEKEVKTIHVDMSSGRGCVNKYNVPTNPDRTHCESPAARAEKEINHFLLTTTIVFYPR